MEYSVMDVPILPVKEEPNNGGSKEEAEVSSNCNLDASLVDIKKEEGTMEDGDKRNAISKDDSDSSSVDIKKEEGTMVDGDKGNVISKDDSDSSLVDIKKEEGTMGVGDKGNAISNDDSDSLVMEVKKGETDDRSSVDTYQPIDVYRSIDPVYLTNSPMTVNRMMKDEVMRQIAGALARNDVECDGTETNFCIEDQLSPKDIDICVKNVGNLQFPLDKNCIEKLIAVSSNAKFGLGEKTLVDKNFCNTQVIESKYLDVKISPNSLHKVIDNVHRALNLPADSILKPHLHNMLIYSPGQFFGEHRDSEKMDNMVATLVVVLPSPHIGGTLVIKHNDRKYTLRSENLEEANAKCVCFFPDCWHEVKKVKCGRRVVLTYNVVLEHGKLIDISLQNKYLEDALRAYFKAVEQKPSLKTRYKKLVVLLNHSYSEHSMKWNLLKGEDLQYARVICSAAKQLNLTVHLGLVSISQQWTSYEYEVNPMDFVESTETVEYWVDERNKKLPYVNYVVPLGEVCFTKETEYLTFPPVKEDFSGPTGNVGATVDYWYKRAAIVLWQQSDSIKAQFELNYQNAMNDLCALVRAPGNETKIKDILQQAGTLVGSAERNKNFCNFAQLALYVRDEDTALLLLSKLGGSIVNSANSALLVELQKLYGKPWFNRLIEAMIQKSPVDCKQLIPFINQFVQLGGDQLMMQTLLEAAVTHFIEQKYYWDWQPKALELLKACVSMKNSSLSGKFIQFLISYPNCFVREDLIKIYYELMKLPKCSGEFELLQEHLVEKTKQDIAKIRSADNWSIKRPLTCDCEICKIVKKFLISNLKMIRIKNIGTIRKHLISKRLPLDISEEGKGKDLSVVLKKQNRIHVEANAIRLKLNALLLTLQEKPDSRKRILGQPEVSTDESLKRCK